MKQLNFILKALLGVAFNSVGGAAIACVLGASPVAGAIGGNALALLVGAFMPHGCLGAGVFTEIWTGEMIKAFRTPKEALGWYDRIKSYDQYVNNDVIHFTELGGDPGVLVNNSTYPLDVESLTDADKPVSLDKFDTKATAVTDDELHACSYDKMASVQERHRGTLKEKKMQKAIHAIAPAEDKTTSPVLVTSGTSGTAADGRKKFGVADLLALKRKFDAMGIPATDRVLVLCSDHINDLLETEQKFKEHYNINQNDGKLCRLYGFDFYEYNGTPYYTLSTKKKLAFGAVPAAGDVQASVAYYNGRMMKANGSVQFYHSEAANDPLYHRNLVNFRNFSICLPLSEKNCTAAIISGQAS